MGKNEKVSLEDRITYFEKNSILQTYDHGYIGAILWISKHKSFLIVVWSWNYPFQFKCSVRACCERSGKILYLFHEWKYNLVILKPTARKTYFYDRSFFTKFLFGLLVVTIFLLTNEGSLKGKSNFIHH